MRITAISPLRNLFVLIFALLLVNANGQTPTPTPDDTVRITTDLIQTNVTVTDKDGRFVNNLDKSQFELRVDGKLIPISFFEHIASNQTTGTTLTTDNPQKSSTTANISLRERKVVFFVDDLHLSLDSLGRTRSAINHFIDFDMMPDDAVAIVSASGQIGFLQQFTNNKAVLRAALARLKVVPNLVKDTDTPPMPEYVAVRILNGDRQTAEYYVDKIHEGLKTKEVSVNRNAMFETVKQRANNIVSGMTAISETSLKSLENLLETNALTGGRKLVYFISDGFYLQTKNGDFIENSRLQRVVNLATRAGSVIYSIDARGLFSLAPDATGERPVDAQGRIDRGAVGEAVLSQEGLFELANETGGRFLKNQNYFEKWIDRTLDENSNYYVLAWTPENGEQSVKKFKKIEVSVIGRPELNVRLQRGYLTSWDKNEGNTKDKQVKKTTEETKQPIPKETNPKKLLPLTLALNYLDVPNVGAVLTSSVQISTSGLDYGASNNQPAAVDVVGLIYNDQGKQVADFKTGLSIAPQPNDKSVSGQNVIYNNPTPLAPGIYQVRVAAREGKTGQVGSATQWIEIPDLTGKQLTLGSLLLGVNTVKKVDKTANQQVQYSVDHRFQHPFRLDFMSFIYNAARNANGETNLTTKIEVLNAHGRAIVSSPVSPLSTKAVADLARIPLMASIPQGAITPGRYLLRVTVNDRIANATAVQQTVFIVE